MVLYKNPEDLQNFHTTKPPYRRVFTPMQIQHPYDLMRNLQSRYGVQRGDIEQMIQQVCDQQGLKIALGISSKDTKYFFPLKHMGYYQKYSKLLDDNESAIVWALDNLIATAKP